MSPSLSLVAGEVQKGAVPRKPFGKPKREIEPGAAPGRGGSVTGNGQPPFIPTDAQRKKVVDLIARKLTNDRISLGIGIPLRTLERHFQPELGTRKLRAQAGVATGIIEAALNGDKAMMLFYAETSLRGCVVHGGAARSEHGMSRSCSVCLHPRRQHAEDLLSQGWSIRRTAFDIGVGAAALHRHWSRHVGNRDTMPAADPITRGNETPGSEALDRADLRQPQTRSRAVPSTSSLILTHPAGGQPFCWCARCLGRRGHYSDGGGLPGKAELMNGIAGVSRRPVRRIDDPHAR
jgi:hypothetical protein